MLKFFEQLLNIRQDITSNIEIGTSKKQTTTSTQTTSSDSRQFIDNRILSLQLNSPGAYQSTKKEDAVSSIPTISPGQSIIPSLSGNIPAFGGGGGGSSDSNTGLDLTSIALIGGLALGGVFLITKKKK